MPSEPSACRKQSASPSRMAGEAKRFQPNSIKFSPLSFVPHGNAGYAIEEGFLLHAARIGDDQRCPGFQAGHIRITNGWGGFDAIQRQPGRLHCLGRARVQWQDDRDLRRHLLQRFEDIS